MFWLIDFCVCFVILIAVFKGLKRGFFNSSYEVISNVLGIMITIAISLVGLSFLIKWGVLNWLETELSKLFSEITFPSKIGLTNEKFFYYSSVIILGVGLLIAVGLVLSNANKMFISQMKKNRENVVFRIVDSSFGVLTNSFFAFSSILSVFSVLKALSFTPLIGSFCNNVKFCPISGVIYELNPLYNVLTSVNIAEKIAETISLFF